MYFLLEKVDFHCYVSLPEGIFFSPQVLVGSSPFRSWILSKITLPVKICKEGQHDGMCFFSRGRGVGWVLVKGWETKKKCVFFENFASSHVKVRFPKSRGCVFPGIPILFGHPLRKPITQNSILEVELASCSWK